jgi:hypothetical protein
MNKIIEYRAITVTGDYKDLNAEVNALMRNGFQPLGGVSTCLDHNTVFFTQAMVRYEVPRTENTSRNEASPRTEATTSQS